jgi:hypothetical protein
VRHCGNEWSSIPVLKTSFRLSVQRHLVPVRPANQRQIDRLVGRANRPIPSNSASVANYQRFGRAFARGWPSIGQQWAAVRYGQNRGFGAINAVR